VKHRGIHHIRHAYVTMLAEQGMHERSRSNSRATRTVASREGSTRTSRTGCWTGAVDAIERVVRDLHAAPDEPSSP